MGGKSRKTGTISKALIDRLKAGGGTAPKSSRKVPEKKSESKKEKTDLWD